MMDMVLNGHLEPTAMQVEIAQTLRLSKEHAEIVSLAAVMSNLGKGSHFLKKFCVKKVR